MATNKKKNNISGRNIYQDEKGRNILYNKNTGIGYLIQEKDERAYSMYKNRFVIVLIGVILALNFLAPPAICVGGGVITAGVLEFRYRKIFLPTLVQITNFKPYKNITLIEQMVTSGDKNKVLLYGILFILFAVLLIFNGIEMKLSNLLMILNLGLAFAAIIFAGFHLFAYTKMRQSDK